MVDEFEHLLGIITHDDAMEIMQEESTEDIEKIAGIGGEQSEETYLNTTILTQFRRRAGWLTGLASGALGTLAFGITCPLDGIVHLGLWHVLPVPLAALAARVIVPPDTLYRWIGNLKFMSPPNGYQIRLSNGDRIFTSRRSRIGRSSAATST